MYSENYVANNISDNNQKCEYEYSFIPSSVTTIEELVNYNKYGIYPFLYLLDLINDGYNFIIGSQIKDNRKILYLLNYEVINAKNEENKMRI